MKMNSLSLRCKRTLYSIIEEGLEEEQKEVFNQIKDKDETSIKLAEILGVTEEEMKEHVYKQTSIERVHPEGRRLSYDVAEKISDLKI
mgnify:CR=1 FL=1